MEISKLVYLKRFFCVQKFFFYFWQFVAQVVEVEDGKKSIKNLTGLRRDSEILYVGTFDKDKPTTGIRGKLSDVFNKSDSLKNSEVLNRKKNEISTQGSLKDQSSMFERPGFGSFAFRYNYKFPTTLVVVFTSIFNLILFQTVQLKQLMLLQEFNHCSIKHFSKPNGRRRN